MFHPATRPGLHPGGSRCFRVDLRPVGVTVLGSRGLSGISTLMLGSVSDAVLHHTRRPALIVRHGTRMTHAGEEMTNTGQALR